MGNTIHHETVVWDFVNGIMVEGIEGGGSGSRPRVVEQDDLDIVTVDPAVTDVVVLLALSQATFFTNPVSAPNSEQRLNIRVTSASPQLLTWDTAYRAGTDLAPLPGTTSGSGLTDRYGFIWNSTSSTYDFVAIAGGF